FVHDHEDLDPTPKAPSEPFRFTPSLLDPTSAAFAAFANQPAGLFTPTPNGANNYNHSHQELDSPNVGISIGTPLSLPNATSMPPPTTNSMHDFAPQTIQPQQFHNYHPFTQPLQAPYLNAVQYTGRPPSAPGSPMDMGEGVDIMADAPLLDGNSIIDGGPMMSLAGKQYDHEQASITTTERFRFHVVLNAPTAMIKHPDEIPVTYLNKGQAYAISIIDTNPPPSSNLPVRYRTYIRISFHDETQRARPAACWQLWKEGRGTNEAHQRGGKLQAVEYVEPNANGDDDKKKGRVGLESASFDSFAVVWSPIPGAPSAEASVSVRFNFLSTDFSHSKGVKGIPVRLCAKTEVLSSGSPRSPAEQPEISFCKVKLFRDHGAERKLANDILHVKKTIEKLRQLSNQTEGTGMKVFGKKNKKEEETSMNKPGKVQKHKRTWSMSSASSVGGGRSQEEDTNAKLASMQDMFTSTRPVSVLYLRGSELDDPDLQPVHLPGEIQEMTDDVWVRRRSSVATTASSFVSPTPSSASLSSRHGDNYAPDRRDWEARGFQSMPHHNGTSHMNADIPVRIKTTNEAGTLSGWIEAIGIDSSYNPPPERPKANMCIYILPLLLNQPQQSPYHRAVYLQRRTADCLTTSIASKCGIDPSSVVRTVRVNSRGLSIFVDDDFVREMSEGQDMKVQALEISDEIPFSPATSGDWGSPENGSGLDGDMKGSNHGWELRLLY
ncbi:hypothetical protein RUND412_004717, partial [Rhizina undulata]